MGFTKLSHLQSGFMSRYQLYLFSFQENPGKYKVEMSMKGDKENVDNYYDKIMGARGTRSIYL